MPMGKQPIGGALTPVAVPFAVNADTGVSRGSAIGKLCCLTTFPLIKMPQKLLMQAGGESDKLWLAG